MFVQVNIILILMFFSHVFYKRDFNVEDPARNTGCIACAILSIRKKKETKKKTLVFVQAYH